jgi:hypothetical protein
MPQPGSLLPASLCLPPSIQRERQTEGERGREMLPAGPASVWREGEEKRNRTSRERNEMGMI